MGAKFCVVASSICWSSVWSLLHVMLLTPRILRWLLDFCQICAPLVMMPSRLVGTGSSNQLLDCSCHIIEDNCCNLHKMKSSPCRDVT